MGCYSGESCETCQDHIEYCNCYKCPHCKMKIADITHNSPVAEMLCSVMKFLDKKEIDYEKEFSVWARLKVCDWWDQHKARDKQKEIKENAIEDKETG